MGACNCHLRKQSGIRRQTSTNSRGCGTTRVLVLFAVALRKPLLLQKVSGSATCPPSSIFSASTRSESSSRILKFKVLRARRPPPQSTSTSGRNKVRLFASSQACRLLTSPSKDSPRPWLDFPPNPASHYRESAGAHRRQTK